MEAEKKTPAVSDVGAWAMNVVSSVSLIMANKQLMSSSGYAFAFGTPLLFSSLLPRGTRADLESGSASRLGGIRGSGVAFDSSFFFAACVVNARSHHADRVPLHGHGARRVDLQRHRLLRLQARPALGARLVLARRQHLHHRDEPQPHAQLRRLLPGTPCSDSGSRPTPAICPGLLVWLKLRICRSPN